MLKASTPERTGLEVSNLGFRAMELKDVLENGGRLPTEEHAGAVLNTVLSTSLMLPSVMIAARNSSVDLYCIVAMNTSLQPSAVIGGATTLITRGWSPEGMMNCIDQSLQRLKTDHVDILQLHNATPDDVRTHDSINTLKEIQTQGKTRFIGISTVLPHIEEFIEMSNFDTFPIPYSAMEPEHEEVIRRAAERASEQSSGAAWPLVLQT